MQRIFGRSPSSQAKVAGRSAASLPLSDHQSGGLISASASGYEVLLDSSSNGGGAGAGSRSTARRDYMLQQSSHRAWLMSADAWGGSRPSRQRPPPRKLVKDPSGSARPSFSLEIADGEKGRSRGGGGGGAWGNSSSSNTRGSNGNSSSNSNSNSGLYGTGGGADGKGIRQKVARWKELHWGGAGSSAATGGPSVSAPP